ncbi:MAG TPA: hypothetical protein VIM06_08010 [Rhodanobacter sp.]
MDQVMRRLSASSTYFYKRVFPIFWFGLLAIFLAIALWAVGHARSTVAPGQIVPFLLLPVAMAIIGFLVFRKLIFDLLDEVWLDGDQLLLKNRDQQARIALADIVNVNATTMTNPRRITLLLRTDSRFGRSVSFMPDSPRGFMSAFQPDPIASELIERVEAIRQARR